MNMSNLYDHYKFRSRANVCVSFLLYRQRIYLSSLYVTKRRRANRGYRMKVAIFAKRLAKLLPNLHTSVHLVQSEFATSIQANIWRTLVLYDRVNAGSSEHRPAGRISVGSFSSRTGHGGSDPSTRSGELIRLRGKKPRDVCAGRGADACASVRVLARVTGCGTSLSAIKRYIELPHARDVHHTARQRMRGGIHCRGRPDGEDGETRATSRSRDTPPAIPGQPDE